MDRGGLLPIHHSGKARPHRHTSYWGLAVLLALTGAVVASAAHAGTTDNGGYQISASVASKKPTTAPTIAAPGAGQSFGQNPVTVHGSCESGTLVNIYKNDVLAGSTICAGGSYNLSIDLFIGQNTLVARAQNTAAQDSPDSAAVPVTFAPPGATAGAIAARATADSLPISQLVLTSQSTYQGFYPGQKASWTLTLSGGTAPYAINVGWGDGKSDLISRGQAGLFQITHAYGKPGAGQSGSNDIVVSAVDANGQHGYLHVIAIVNTGHTAATPAGTTAKGGTNILIAGLALGGAVLLVAAFWLGEQREKRILQKVNTGAQA